MRRCTFLAVCGLPLAGFTCQELRGEPFPFDGTLLDDPQGGVYGTAFVAGRKEPRHGWLLPGDRLLCWDGVVVPFLKPGAPASLETDFANLPRLEPIHEGLWRAPTPLIMQTLRARATGKKPPVTSPHRLASEWLSAHYLRALSAHARADDALAETLARRALEAIPHLPEGTNLSLAFSKESLPTVLEQLATDARRRLKEAKNPPPAPKDEIAAQIAALQDEKMLGTWSMFGLQQGATGASGKLLAIGLPAVEPLLACAESDTRLLRGHTAADHGFPLEQRPMSVRRLALHLAAQILKISEAPRGGTLGVAYVRDYARRFASAPEPLRYQRVLEADEVSADQWNEAARSLLKHPESRKTLDAKAVSPLLERRARQLMDRKTLGWPLADAIPMAIVLDAWSPSEAKELSAELIRRGRDEVMHDPAYPEEINSIVASPTLELLIARLERGDDALFTLYADWLLETKPLQWGHLCQDALEGLWLLADDPRMQQLARKLFAPGSPWTAGELSSPRTIRSLSYFPGHEMPLLRLPAFRDSMRAALSDKEIIGECWRTEQGVQYRASGGASGSFGAISPGPHPAPLNEKRPLRRCDFLILSLATFPGAPPFRPYWTEAQKDAEIEKFSATLETLGSREPERHSPYLQTSLPKRITR